MMSYVKSSYWTTKSGTPITKCKIDQDNQTIYPDVGMCSYTVLFEDGYRLNKLYLSNATYEDTGRYVYNSVISAYNNEIFQNEIFISVNGK